MKHAAIVTLIIVTLVVGMLALPIDAAEVEGALGAPGGFLGRAFLYISCAFLLHAHCLLAWSLGMGIAGKRWEYPQLSCFVQPVPLISTTSAQFYPPG